ncbi:MAG TPA: iron ABC transporter permease, partial [bacterium]|nr:iron ABC transporter permease [bacterium]
MSLPRRPVLILALMLMASIGILLANLGFGSSGWVWPHFLASEGVELLEHNIVMQLRLPRTLAALAVGGLLALAGSLIQALTRNPLADPYILGISGGAAVGGLLAILLGLAAWMQQISAALGAFGALLLVIALAHGEGAWTRQRLLLTGVVLASALGAVITLLLALAPETALRGMLFWLMGDLSGAPAPWPALGGLGLLALLVQPWARDLNILTRGAARAGRAGRAALV